MSQTNVECPCRSVGIKIKLQWISPEGFPKVRAPSIYSSSGLYNLVCCNALGRTLKLQLDNLTLW